MTEILLHLMDDTYLTCTSGLVCWGLVATIGFCVLVFLVGIRSDRQTCQPTGFVALISRLQLAGIIAATVILAGIVLAACAVFYPGDPVKQVDAVYLWIAALIVIISIISACAVVMKARQEKKSKTNVYEVIQINPYEETALETYDRQHSSQVRN